jgi:hypothetical protein
MIDRRGSAAISRQAGTSDGPGPRGPGARWTSTRKLRAVGLGAALIAWYEVVPHLGRTSRWPSIALISILLMPAMFGMTWLSLPASNSRRLPVVSGVLIVLAVVLSELGQDISSNFAKFAAVTAVGWLFLGYFEALSWVVLVAFLIPWVDAYSVWRGPTKAITTHHADVFGSLSVAFVAPGGGAARLGLPDILFFAVFLAATVRFGLRPRATWIAMTASLGVTMALATWWNVDGLPALPGLSLGFLLANADLLWRRLRGRRFAPADAEPESGR